MIETKSRVQKSDEKMYADTNIQTILIGIDQKSGPLFTQVTEKVNKESFDRVFFIINQISIEEIIRN